MSRELGIISILREALYRDRGEPETHLWAGVVNGVLGSALFPPRVRVALYRAMGMRGIDSRAVIRSGVIFRSRYVSIGRGTTVGYRALFDNRTELVIGANVGIGSYTVFVDAEHEVSDPERRAGPTTLTPVRIESGARISTGSMILSGVSVGAGAVVGAGSLVTADCEPHALYVGRPARKIRDLPR